MTPTLLADIRRELSKTRPAAPTLDERVELLDLLQRAAAERPPEPPADLVERLALISRDARGESKVVADPQQRSFEEWCVLVERDGIRAVLRELAAGDVGEWVPTVEAVRAEVENTDVGEMGDVIAEDVHRLFLSHLAPRLTALRAQVFEANAACGDARKDAQDLRERLDALEHELTAARIGYENADRLCQRMQQQRDALRAENERLRAASIEGIRRVADCSSPEGRRGAADGAIAALQSDEGGA